LIVDAVGSVQVWQIDARQLARLHARCDVVVELREPPANVVRADIGGFDRVLRKEDGRADRGVARA
jgi:hypothetical protein